ncbi:MAG TPA: alpha/beta hydrolase-fold protein [Gemmatimonadaceae bacterium]|nr:alpha/beta hydrolase-fold protein [Gemmatimonadaceae bacterium]
MWTFGLLLTSIVFPGSRPLPRNAAIQTDSSRVVVLTLDSDTFHNTRAVRVYLPAGYDSERSRERRYPVFYLNDGFSVFSARGWNAPGILDSLMAARSIPPMIVVGIDNAASITGARNPARDRANEFLPWPDSTEPDLSAPRGLKYPAFVVHEVMPLISRRFRTLSGPENTGIGGSSYGGIAALVTVLGEPRTFGTLLLESTPLFLFHERLIAESRTLRTWPRAIAVGVGTRETDDERLNAVGTSALQRFVALARERSPGSRVDLAVVEGAAHNAAAWRARLPGALTFLFGARSE